MPSNVKYQRNYLLSIQKRGSKEFVNIQKPFTLEFDINRSIFSDANKGWFRIYNLAEKTRAEIYHDRYRVLDADAYQRIQMFAGYDSTSTKSAVFIGNLLTANSMKEGPNWKTEVTAFDGFFAMLSGNINVTSGPAWDVPTILRTIAGTLPFVSVGAIGALTTKNSRPVSMVGNSWDVFNRVAKDANCFIDNGVINAITDTEYIQRPGQVDIVANPDNIIGTPRRSEGVIEVDMIFAPEAFVGQRVILRSLESVYDGQYVVRGIRHHGIISDAVCGEAVTTLTMWAAYNLTPVTTK